MRFLRYKEDGGPRVVLVKDPASLPKVGKGWVAAGHMDMNPGDGPRIAANTDEIIASIEAHGFFMAGAPDA